MQAPLGSREVPDHVERAFLGLIGTAPAFQRVLDMAKRAAATECSVLIVGETGTGKELFARALHRASNRRSEPFVAINCGAISRELIASELFGHERGSFTGATRDRDGVFVQANGGTLFLDELGELPLGQQPNLLRVLETRTVRPLGSPIEHPVDVRVISATNRLAHLGSEASRLRLDLFHRVATVVLALPPLRERAEDIPLLVRVFMSEFSQELGPSSISHQAMRALTSHAWPGNVRELRQAIMRAMALGNGQLQVEHLLPHHLIATGRREQSDPPRTVARDARQERSRVGLRVRIRPGGDDELRPIDRIIRRALVDALRSNTSMREAARSLGMARSTFSDWSKRLGIELE